MINQQATSGSQRRTRSCRPGLRTARLLILLAAFVCAACGLVYELELVALASYLLGDSVTQASVVLSVMVFAMGLGSLLAKRFTGSPAISFAALECCLALIGGLSVLALYGSFVWIGHWYRATLVGFALLIGVLMGAEIPLLVTLIERFRRSDGTEPGRTVADLFAADYVGALVGGLAFPFLLLPRLGEAAGALLTGAVNALAGAGVVLWLDPERRPSRMRAALWACCGAVLAVLALAAAGSDAFERAARQALYGAPVFRAAEQTRYQQIVLTGPQTRLYLGGTPTACPGKLRTERELTRLARPYGRVLVVGGGDGLLARDLLRQPRVGRVLLVERDPELLRLARRDPGLAALNGHAFADSRIRTVSADAFAWLREATPARGGPGGGPGTGFDAILLDPTEPASDDDLRKLSSQEFYGLLVHALRPGGRLAVRTDAAGLWAGASTMAAVGEPVRAYRLPGGCGPEPQRALIAGPVLDGARSLGPPAKLPPPATLLRPVQ